MPTCPHCGYESSGQDNCPLCGAHVAGGYAEEVGDTAEPGPRPAWEDSRTPFPASAFETWRASTFDPTGFFQGAPWSDPLPRPILYYLLIHVVAAAFTLMWSTVGLDATMFATFGEWGMEGPGAASALVGFFLTPFFALVQLFGWAAVLHVFVFIFAPRHRDYRASVRAVSYASSPMLFTAIPLIGPLVASVWVLVLTIFGISAAHRTSGGRATAIVLAPVVIVFGVLLFALFVLGVALMGVLGALG